MLPILTTERLVLRPLVPDDAEAAHRFLSDPDVMRYWSSAPHRDVAETAAYIAGNVADGERPSWAITFGGGEALGWVGLGPRREGVRELYYILRRDHWGQGIAREAVTAAIAHGFGAMKLRRIFADADPDNLGSVALLERLGFRREGRLRGEWETHLGVRDSLIYGLLAEEWQ